MTWTSPPVLPVLGAALLAFGCMRPPEPNQPGDVDAPRAQAAGDHRTTAFDSDDRFAARQLRLDLGTPFDSCGLNQVNFAFDEPGAAPQAQYPFQKLADCLVIPPERGSERRPAHRADPPDAAPGSGAAKTHVLERPPDVVSLHVWAPH
jgi:hypothetical protein